MHLIREPGRPIIKIFLISVFPFLSSSKTPFHATIFPPLTNQFTVATNKGHELDAISTTRHGTIILSIISMIRNEDRFSGCLKFLMNWFRAPQKIHIGVEICHAFHRGISIEYDFRSERRQGPTILHTRAFRLYLQQLRRFNFSERREANSALV